MRERILKASFAVSAFVTLLGASAVDTNPVAGMVMFLAGGLYCFIFAYQNGGI